MYLKCIGCVFNCLTAAGMLKAYITRIWTVLYSIWCVFGMHTSNTRILSVFDLYFHTYLNLFNKYVKIHSRYTQIHATKTVCIWSFANTHRIRINTRIYANTLKYALNTIKYGGVKSESIWSKNRVSPPPR